MLFRPPVGDGGVPPLGWRITNPFGNYYQLQPGAFAYHTGIDAVIGEGSSARQPIYAIADGRVTFARRVPNSTWGNVLVIQHTEPDGNHFYSRYGHDDDFLIDEGEHVCVGQMVAHVGNAFGVFPYHLHFDVSLTETLLVHPADWPGLDLERLRQTYIDPIVFLQRQQMASPGERITALAQQIITEAGNLAPSVPPPAATPRPAIVAGPAGSVNVRVAPATGTVVKALPNGTALNVVDSTTALWSQITDGTYAGDFIYTLYLSFN
jgi:hypothetical protein